MSNSKNKKNHISKEQDTRLSKNIISDKLKNQISHLSYEESLDELDIILDQMQKEDIPLEKLEEFFLKGHLYLENCERLLTNIEQKIIYVDPKDLK